MGSAVPRVAAPAGVPPRGLLQAPPHWRRVDFISDLHLQASDHATVKVWQNFMQRTSADAVFILGDLFEVWVGDDVIDGSTLHGPTADPELTRDFAGYCGRVLADAARRLAIFFIHGNRDFLLGPAFAKASGMTLLADPTLLDFGGNRWLLSHGDALCLQDSNYMQFRTQVRSAQWQQEFLAKPLIERQKMARALRTQSEAHKSRVLANGVVLAEPDAQLTSEWLLAAHASTLIHGHTHRPAEHALPDGRRRIVLSDWDALATPARASVLRLSLAPQDQTGGVGVERLPPALA